MKKIDRVIDNYKSYQLTQNNGSKKIKDNLSKLQNFQMKDCQKTICIWVPFKKHCVNRPVTECSGSTLTQKCKKSCKNVSYCTCCPPQPTTPSPNPASGTLKPLISPTRRPCQPNPVGPPISIVTQPPLGEVVLPPSPPTGSIIYPPGLSKF